MLLCKAVLDNPKKYFITFILVCKLVKFVIKLLTVDKLFRQVFLKKLKYSILRDLFLVFSQVAVITPTKHIKYDRK